MTPNLSFVFGIIGWLDNLVLCCCDVLLSCSKTLEEAEALAPEQTEERHRMSLVCFITTGFDRKINFNFFLLYCKLTAHL